MPLLRSVLGALVVVPLVLFTACGSDSSGSAATAPATAEALQATASTPVPASSLGPTTGDCEAITSTLRTVTSANPDLPDPELTSSCDGDTVVVSGNGIPDYEYEATSPGNPAAQDLDFMIPVSPTVAASPGDVARLGSIAVAVNGVPIYGPTEGTGGDVLSLTGALSACGSHNGPTGFHLHLFGSAAGVDCLYSQAEVTSGEPLVVGWSVDGYPIMSGRVCDDETCTSTKQLKSSWQLTDESAFATDTWSAHSYVEGSGDLDKCNGRIDEDGQYRYYTTITFPYVMGCYTGEVAAGAIPGPQGGPPG